MGSPSSCLRGLATQCRSPHKIYGGRTFEGEAGSLEHRIWLTKKRAGGWLGAKARRRHSQELSPSVLDKCMTEQGPDVLKPLNGSRELLEYIQSNQKTLGFLPSVADWQVGRNHRGLWREALTRLSSPQAVVNYETWTNVLTEEERELLKVPGTFRLARPCWILSVVVWVMGRREMSRKWTKQRQG